jgi:hypothetical protein
MATAVGDSTTTDTVTDSVESTQPEVSEETTIADPEPTRSRPEPPANLRRTSTLADPDPNAFRITILLASSGYRSHISVNRAFLEKASLHEGEGFPVSVLKSAIWKDWPSGNSVCSATRANVCRLA